jgi:branched-chain amino acid transport system ATP-binding protein
MSILSVSGLSKSFGGLQAVDSLSFELEPGGILGLIGPNGAGKTTVFNCITGFIPPDAGEVRLEGADLGGLQPHQICKRGLVRTFQIVRPFLNINVLDNVMVGAMMAGSGVAAARDRAREIIGLVGLERYTDAPAGSLPLPLRKRLELARALSTRPRVLLLDEVMAGLTPTEVGQLIGLIHEVRDRGVSVLLIEHVMQGVMALCEEIVVINYGRRIARGAPEEVVRQPAVVEAYLGEEYAGAHG